MEVSDGATVQCSHELCVKVANESNLQSETQLRVTQTRDNYYSGIFLEGLRKNYEKPQSGYSVYQHNFKPYTF